MSTNRNPNGFQKGWKWVDEQRKNTHFWNNLSKSWFLKMATWVTKWRVSAVLDHDQTWNAWQTNIYRSQNVARVCKFHDRYLIDLCKTWARDIWSQKICQNFSIRNIDKLREPKVGKKKLRRFLRSRKKYLKAHNWI